MKFWKSALFSLILIAGLLSAFIFNIWNISEHDEKSYQELLNVSSSKTTFKSISQYAAKQLKEGTAKTLLLKDGEARRVGLLTSESSELFFAKAGSSKEVIESMENISLVFQEDFSNGFQTVLHLQANHADYYYTQEKLLARDVQMIRYKIPSYVFTKKAGFPFFKGTAEKVEISFGDKEPKIFATKLKAVSE